MVKAARTGANSARQWLWRKVLGRLGKAGAKGGSQKQQQQQQKKIWQIRPPGNSLYLFLFLSLSILSALSCCCCYFVKPDMMYIICSPVGILSARQHVGKKDETWTRLSYFFDHHHHHNDYVKRFFFFFFFICHCQFASEEELCKGTLPLWKIKPLSSSIHRHHRSNATTIITPPPPPAANQKTKNQIVRNWYSLMYWSRCITTSYKFTFRFILDGCGGGLYKIE